MKKNRISVILVIAFILIITITQISYFSLWIDEGGTDYSASLNSFTELIKVSLK